MEQPSSGRFVRTWSTIGASTLDEPSRFALANVAWALAALERAWVVLLEDAVRLESIKREGAPAIMHFLSGPYKQSLEYLLGTSLWMDLGEVLAAYRTVVDRFRFLKGPARRGSLRPLLGKVTNELEVLEQRRVPALSPEPLISLANRVLHESWHPAGNQYLAFELHWRRGNGEEVDLAADPVIDPLGAEVEQTSRQVNAFFDVVLVPRAGETGQVAGTASTDNWSSHPGS
jgi:hypothetical protein